MRFNLAGHQRRARSRMLDRCEIREPDSWAGETVQEGVIAHTYRGGSQIPCRVRVDDTDPRTMVVGGETVTVTKLRVMLPLDVCPSVGQVITINAARIDSALAERRFDVDVADVGSQVIERRVLCSEHL